MLHLVRHGEAEGNRERRFIGQQDVVLSELGHRQAALVADRLARSGVVRVVSSDLARARATAQPLAEALGVTIELDAGLREVDNGLWSGLLATEIEAGWPAMWAEYRAGADVARPEGERWADVAARARVVVERLLDDGEPTAVFTHGGPLLCLAAWASGIAVAGNVFTGPIAPAANGAITTILPGPRLAAYNDTGHLGAAMQDDGRLPFLE
jgi:probable phosphoglycerate mutase